MFMKTRKTIIFTGGTSGLGKYAVEKLLEKEVELYLLARNEERFEALQKDLKCNLNVNCKKLHFIEADLSDFSSILKAVNEIKKNVSKIDLLILNAGLWAFEPAKSKDGIELTFQVNVLANYVLIDELLPLMHEGQNSKVIVTASALHQGTINFNDIEWSKKPDGFKTYRQSKLAVITMLKRFARVNTQNNKVVFLSQHPGVVDTGLSRGANWFIRLFFRWFGSSLEKGAQTLLFLTEKNNNELENGGYYANKKLKKANPQVSEDAGQQEKLIELCRKYIAKLV